MKMKEFVLTSVLFGHGYKRASHTDKKITLRYCGKLRQARKPLVCRCNQYALVFVWNYVVALAFLD